VAVGFLREGEDPARVLAPQTARRIALDAALKEIEEGRRSPSSEWKTRFGLMLGLERVLSERPPRLASGTELRRHQIDALAGMLTELIAANQKGFLEALNGNGTVTAEELTEAEVEENGEAIDAELDVEPESENGVAQKPDPGAVRRFRFRHPTASGKTIAAAGFVEAARTIGVLILTHRRLLVSQFNRELKDEGYDERITPEITGDGAPPKRNPITIQTYAWFARHGAEHGGNGSVLAPPVLDVRRSLGVGGKPGLDREPPGSIKLPVDESVKGSLGHLEIPAIVLSGAHFTVLSLGSSALPVSVRRAALARPRRDIRVPAGMPRIAAASV